MDGNRSDDQVASSDPACPQQSCRLVLDGRSRWALTSCAHCRDYKHSACVLSCYGKVAHHREVVLVNDAGARESIGLLSEGQGPPPTGVLGRRVVLDQAAIDDGVICIVSCPSCAGQPLGSCMDAGHEQQERYTEDLPSRTTRRVSIPRRPFASEAGDPGPAANQAVRNGADAHIGTANRRIFECDDGVRYVMPMYIYLNQASFRVELSWRKGQFLVNDARCSSGRLALGSKPTGLTMGILVTKMMVRDIVWWDKTGKIHPLVAAQVFRSWHKPLSSDRDGDVVTITMNKRDGKPGHSVTMTKGELRKIYASRSQRIEKIYADAWKGWEAYPDRPETCAMHTEGSASQHATAAPGPGASTCSAPEKRATPADGPAAETEGGNRGAKRRKRARTSATATPAASEVVEMEVDSTKEGFASKESTPKAAAVENAADETHASEPTPSPDERRDMRDVRDGSTTWTESRPPVSSRTGAEATVAAVEPLVTYVVPEREDVFPGAGASNARGVCENGGSCVVDDTAGNIMIPQEVGSKAGSTESDEHVGGANTVPPAAANLSPSPGDDPREPAATPSASSPENDAPAARSQVSSETLAMTPVSSSPGESSSGENGHDAKREDEPDQSQPETEGTGESEVDVGNVDGGVDVVAPNSTSPTGSVASEKNSYVEQVSAEEAVVAASALPAVGAIDGESNHNVGRAAEGAMEEPDQGPMMVNVAAEVGDCEPERAADAREAAESEIGSGSESRPVLPSVARAKNLQNLRVVERARFAQCQRREMEESKRRCREELAPLEATLEAVKQRLRRELRELSERQAHEMEEFLTALYGSTSCPPPSI